MKYEINVNDTPEKEDYLVVIIIDDKNKTSSSFALGRKEKSSVALRLIKSGLEKVSIINAKQEHKTIKTKKPCKSTKSTRKKPSEKKSSKSKSKKK